MRHGQALVGAATERTQVGVDDQRALQGAARVPCGESHQAAALGRFPLERQPRRLESHAVEGIQHEGGFALVGGADGVPHGAAGGVMNGHAVDAAARKRIADFQGEFFDLRQAGLDGRIFGGAHERSLGRPMPGWRDPPRAGVKFSHRRYNVT